MKKAQLMIEYMVILVIMLLLFNSISLDLINVSTEDAVFLQIAETINASRIVLTDATTMISMQGSGAKRAVHLRAPPDCDYSLIANTVIVECNISSKFYANFTGQFLTPSSVPTGITYAISGGFIESGNLGSVIISKA